MIAEIPFPQIDPEIIGFDIGDFHLAIRWYALAYIAGLILGWRLILREIQRADYPFRQRVSPAAIDDLLTSVIVFMIIGGRLFYCLIYNPSYYLSHPLDILKVWQGGMSFHGGFIGVILAIIFTARKHQIPTLALGDLAALVAPIGLFFGRIANFINGELYGKVTDVAWAMRFPAVIDGQLAWTEPRHPSQLYEAGLEGLLLFFILLWFAHRRHAYKRPGTLIGIFFIGYGLARSFVEFFRNPDAQFLEDNINGFVFEIGGYGLQMGQVLSLPMILIGIGFLLYAYSRPPAR